MLIKKADDQSGHLQELERLATGAGPAAKRAAEELRIRKAGLKGEAESAYLIDFDYGSSANWAVIHDLRLEHGGRVAQIDHVLINRFMEVYVLETKQFHSGVKITEDGEFMRWNAYRHNYEGMASPLEQNERHIAVLREAMKEIELPVRLGVRIPLEFHSLVMVAPSARIDRPKKFDASRVIKADQLKKSIWKDIDNENSMLSLLKVTKLVASETVEYVARQLVERHVPLTRQSRAPNVTEPTPTSQGARTSSSGRIEPTFAAPKRAVTPKAPSQLAPKVEEAELQAPVCKKCGKRAGDILHGKYGYYFKCNDCGSNTAIRLSCQPGHKPRLRKDKNAFYRECAECNTSSLFHRNTPEIGK